MHVYGHLYHYTKDGCTGKDSESYLIHQNLTKRLLLVISEFSK